MSKAWQATDMLSASQMRSTDYVFGMPDLNNMSLNIILSLIISKRSAEKDFCNKQGSIKLGHPFKSYAEVYIEQAYIVTNCITLFVGNQFKKNIDNLINCKIARN